MRDWRNLRGKTVCVKASGVTYRGCVVEMGEAALVLRTAGGVCEVPWDRVTAIDEVGPGQGGPSGPGGRSGPMPVGWE